MKEKVAIMKTNGLEIFLQPCTQVSIFVLHFIAKMKLTPSFYFQIPSEKSQPWKTLAIQQKAYPADWDQNKATTNRKQPSSIQSMQAPRKKSVLPFHARKTTEWQHHTSVPQPQQVWVTNHISWKSMTDNSKVKPSCHSHAKCKLYYMMGRDWVV